MITTSDCTHKSACDNNGTMAKKTTRPHGFPGPSHLRAYPGPSRSLPRSLTPWLTTSLSPSRTNSLTRPPTHPFAHSLAHWLTHLLPRSLPLLPLVLRMRMPEPNTASLGALDQRNIREKSARPGPNQMWKLPHLVDNVCLDVIVMVDRHLSDR